MVKGLEYQKLRLGSPRKKKKKLRLGGEMSAPFSFNWNKEMENLPPTRYYSAMNYNIDKVAEIGH